MSGSATFAGANYQARVIGHVYVHILAQARLGWLERFDDTPVGVSGETEGPGDDARIEFGERHTAIEVQAKHGLTGGAKLSEAVARVRDRSTPDDTTDVIFVVDRGSSRTVHIDFARDLERFRAGRTDHLCAEVTRLADELGTDRDILRRLYVVTADLDRTNDPERKLTNQLLELVLEDPQQATAAWAVLAADAADICAKKLRRTRKELVDLLAAAKIGVRLPSKDERFMRQLDLSKRLLAEGKAEMVLTVLAILDADLKGKDVEPRIRYRIAQHRAAALLTVNRAREALTAAREALDIDAAGIHALLTAAHAAAQTGELSVASQFIDRAIAADAVNIDAWAAKAQINALAGAPSITPSTAIAASEEYQLALAQIATNAGDWTRVEEITRALLARGLRDPKMLSLRIAGLAALSEGDDSAAAGERRADAERFATEAIESLPEDHPLVSRLLVQRAELRRERGDGDGCEADLAMAFQLNDADPDAVAHLAQAQLHAGHPDYALQTLRSRVTDEYPMLLVIRAQALADTGDDEGARRDLEAALSRVNDAPQPDALRIYASEVALALHNAILADQVLDAVTSDAIAPEMQATLRGRAAFQRGDAEAMQFWFRNAATRAPRLKPKLFSELAQRLMRLGRTREAVAIFDEIGLDALPAQLHSDYAGALMETNDLVRAAKLVDDISRTSAAPDWALYIAADIAARQGDTTRAIALLTMIAERRPNDHRVAFELARRLLAMKQPAEATPYLDALTARSNELSPAERMGVAHLLKEARRGEDAIALAFSAFRTAPQDPAIHRGFGSLLMTDPPTVTHPGVVTEDTYMKLTSDDGAEREYVIYRQPPIDALRKEILLDDAEKAGYVGKRVGDVVVTNANTWPEQRWTVAEILPAVVYVFRDVIARYEERFPGEPFFVHMIKLPDENSVKFLAPIISSLQARKARAEEIFRLYRENTLPVGFVAGMLGATVPDVMMAATTPGAGLGPLRVEWFDAKGQDESRDVARHAKEIVLTRSALQTFSDLDLLDVMRDAYVWLAPQSLLDAIRRDLAEAEEKCAKGQRTMMTSDAGLRFDELPARDPTLTARVDRTRALLQWVESHARVEFRPLETIAAPGSREEEVRSTLGHDSMDAVRISEYLGVALLADDLGLRRLLPKGSRGRSFSSVSLIPALVERAVIPADTRDSLLLRLVERDYIVIVPTRALLVAAIRQAQGAASVVSRAFALLGGPVLDLSSAARVAAEVLKATVLAPVQLMDLEQLVKVALESMAARWAPGLCVYALTKAAAAELGLLPQHLKTVRDASTAFVRSRS